MDDVEKTIKVYDETAVEYADNVRDIIPSGMEYFVRRLKPDSYILDLGCGSGRDARLFVDKGHRVIGVDLSSRLIDIARKDVPEVEFILRDIRKLNFGENVFDAIWCVASLVHVPKADVDSVLNRCYSSLKSGGIMYISVKKGKGEMVLPDVRYGGKKKFWSFFTKEEIVSYALKHGFEILDEGIFVADDDYATNPWLDIFCKKG